MGFFVHTRCQGHYEYLLVSWLSKAGHAIFNPTNTLNYVCKSSALAMSTDCWFFNLTKIAFGKF